LIVAAIREEVNMRQTLLYAKTTLDKHGRVRVDHIDKLSVGLVESDDLFGVLK
jgi:hypothetical protein